MNATTTHKVGQYEMVSRDAVIHFPNGKQYRVILYGAYNAFGLIGSEKNGVAILDEQQKAVVCDEIAKQDSGYCGPSAEQVRLWQEIIAADFSAFREFVNNHPNNRYAI